MRRIPELDALRGIAAVVIMVIHLRFLGRYPIWGTAFDVDLFFVLSGFFITASIMSGSKARNYFRVFYFRRALRIWPIYFLALVACLALNPVLPRPDPLDGLGFYLTFTQGVQHYWGGVMPSFSRLFTHTWTLAIEEQFYLFWPLLVYRASRRRVVALALPLVAAPVVLRSCGYNFNLLATRCDGLAFGALLAAMLKEPQTLAAGRLRAYRRAFAVVGLVAFLAPAWASPLADPIQRAWPTRSYHMIFPSLGIFRTCLVDFCLVGLVVGAAGNRWLAPLRHPWPIGAGRISYGLYIYHPFVFGLGTLAQVQLGLRNSWAVYAAKMAACFAVAGLSWRWFERPIMDLKDRLKYDEGPAPTGSDVLRGPHVGVGAAVAAGSGRD